jgi:hypothetical protein
MAQLRYDYKRRRALNIVWDVSEDYQYDPDFLSFSPEDHQPNLYLNAVIGLTRKYYDMHVLQVLFDELKQSALADLFSDLLWLGLEGCVYVKELPKRPVMAYLRKEQARQYFAGPLSIRHGVAQEMQAARWHEVLGEKTGLSDPWAKSLYKALTFDPAWTTEEVCDHFRRLSKKYFVSRFLVRESLEKVIISHPVDTFLKFLVPRFARREESVLNFQVLKHDENELVSGKKERNGLMALLTGQTAVKNYQYIVSCFGASIYNASKVLDIERNCCIGSHRGSHLHFTRGRLGSRGTVGEASQWLQNAMKQRARNLAYYKENNERYRKSIAHLATQIRTAMQMTRMKLPIPAKSGTLVPGLVWRGIYLDDAKIFYGEENVSTPNFTVDIMLDASASRGEFQRVIAAQAYVIAEALRQCGIPYQIYSFCTLRGYTVMTLFQTYEEKKKSVNVFNYCATGWNRDGLALRGARQLMGDIGRTRKILIMLTDASPNDDRPLFDGNGMLRQHEYRGPRAIADTAAEAAALRREGVRIIGLINDEISGGMEQAEKIFGKDLVRVKDLDKMAESVGKALCHQISTF